MPQAHAIRAPKQNGRYEGRIEDCQRAVGEEILLTLRRIRAAGWTEREAFEALSSGLVSYLWAAEKEGERDASGVASTQLHYTYSQALMTPYSNLAISRA